MSKHMLGKGSGVSKGGQNNLSDQLQEVLSAVQSARRHLPFLSVPDMYLFRAEETLQELVKNLKKS